MKGLLPKVQCSIIANFYGKKCFKGEHVCFPVFLEDGWQKEPTIYCVMRLIDAGESVAQKEGQGRQRKLTKLHAGKGDILKSR